MDRPRTHITTLVVANSSPHHLLTMTRRAGTLAFLIFVGLVLLAVITLTDGACEHGVVNVHGILHCFPEWVWTA